MFSSNRNFFRALCWLMAFVTAGTPSLTTYAQAPQGRTDLLSVGGVCRGFNQAETTAYFALIRNDANRGVASCFA